MNQETQTIQDEVQASAQINDNEEIIPAPTDWKPLSLQDEAGKWEICIIRKDYYEMLMAQDEQIHFGGGHPRKIVLFGSEETENQIPLTNEWVEWAMGIAHSMSLSFNNGKHPFPEDSGYSE